MALFDEVFGVDAPYDEVPRERAPVSMYVGFGLLLAAIAGTVGFAVAPSPYVVERPGPVYDTLGEVRDGDDTRVPLIDISETETYPTSGRLDLLTVYIDGSRERPIAWLEVAQAWFDPSRTVLPVDVVYPAGQTEDEADEESALQMSSSQQDSVAAALAELGVPFDSVLTIGGVIDDTPADGVLEPGDQVLTADGRAIVDVDDLRAALADAGVGTEVNLGIRREDRELTVTLAPLASEQDGSPVIGVYPTTTYDFPFEVSIRLSNVGGPSAGMMFALGIYDKLTPGALTGDEHIAGTGTIDADGRVGAIGGIVQKMYGASGAGADWFLAPVENCREAVGRIPSGLDVFAVATLDEAIAVVEGIADGDTARLARCG